MKITTPEIIWHNKQPLLSVDFHRGASCLRLATGGADNDVKIWKISNEKDGDRLRIVFMASLSRHTKAVNVVRFSPNGEFLASAGDDTVVHIWRLNSDDPSSVGVVGNLVSGSSDTSPSKNKENWSVVKLLRGHLEDIYDICWSPDSLCLVSGSVDNSAIVWDVNKGQQIAVLKESKQYIQGVAWDPLGEYITTLSTDRSLRVYSIDQKFKCVHTVNKLTLADSKQIRLWVDEVNSFFRRLTFTPDGSFLIAPAGRFESEDKVTNVSYVFTRNNLSKPVLQLPGEEKASVVVKCCPVLFELKEQPSGATTITSLSYRMVYAVASLDSVFLYDTQHITPFAYISKIHYSGITDLAWSDDGLTLVVASSDCYCTIVTFDPNEFGVPLTSEKLPPNMSNIKQSPQPIASPSLPVTKSENDKETTQNKVSPSSSSLPPLADSTATSTTVNVLKPRRIRPTMVSSVTSPNGKAAPSSTTPVTSCPPSSELQNRTEKDGVDTTQKSKDEQPVSSSSNVAGSKGPRRISLTTLSTYRPKNQSATVDSTSSTSKEELKDTDCIIIE